MLIVMGACIHAVLSLKAAIARSIKNRRQKRRQNLAPWQYATRRAGPRARSALYARRCQFRFPAFRCRAPMRRPPSVPRRNDPHDFATPEGKAHITPAAASLKSGQRLAREVQPSMFDRFGHGKYQLPPLADARRAEKASVGGKISEDALEQNARLLEGVLDDFGVKGEIINVRPGPVVTLYELEPAPGIKSSRVIGLADDIARSMSAISARVAVVPGPQRDRHRTAEPAPRDRLPARTARLRRISRRPSTASPSRSARRSAASRSSSISPACRICSSPAPPAPASRSRSTP